MTLEGQPTAVTGAVTALFVPGDRPERFAKATATAADLIIVDLEDAVAPEDKPKAREYVLDFLTTRRESHAAIVIRINALESIEAPYDNALVVQIQEHDHTRLAAIMIAKAESAVAIRNYGAEMIASKKLAIVPLIESAHGMASCAEIAEVPCVTRLAFGAVDYALDIGGEDTHGALDSARSALVLASRIANIAAPLDSPSIEIRDLRRVEADARRARSFGFGGKLCIHPLQLDAVATAFLPTAEQIEWALSIIDHGESAGQINGQMVDRPVIARARRILSSRQTAI